MCFFMLSKHVLNVIYCFKFLNVTFLTSICLVNYIYRWFLFRILILHFSYMNNFSHYVLCFNQLQYLYFIYHQIVFWMWIGWLLMLHFFPLYVKLLLCLVGFEPTTSGFAARCLQHVTTVPRKTMDMNCYLYIYILICFEMFKFCTSLCVI